MERDTESSKGWQREILALPRAKSDEIPEKYGHSTCPPCCNFCLYGNEFGICSFSMHPASEPAAVDSTDGYWNLSSLPLHSRKIVGTVSDYTEPSVFCSEPMHIGLNLGRPKEYGDNFSHKNLVSTIPVSGTVSKRSRAYYPGVQNPFCQVDGCNLDLTSAKDYHRRHRICESHSKCPSITVSGRERRFCQQCSRLHDLSEFDDKKRSCRRRLSDHNARRRRQPPEPTKLGLPGVLLSSALYDQRPHNVLVDRLSVPVLNQTWEKNSISMVGAPSKVGGLEGTACFSGNKIHDSDTGLRINQGMLCAIQIPSPQNLEQCSNVPPANRQATSDLLSVHSLLSYNPWTLNEAIPTPTAYASDANLNYNPERNLDPHHWAAAVHSSNNISTEQGGTQPPEPGTPQLQEFHLLRADYESGFNHSNQRIL